jgi:hypothetical protein
VGEAPSPKYLDEVRQRATSKRWTVSTCRVNSEESARQLGYAFETALFTGADAKGDRDFVEVLDRYPDAAAALAGHLSWCRRIRESGYSAPPNPFAPSDEKPPGQ